MIELNKLSFDIYKKFYDKFDNTADLANLKRCSTEIAEASFNLSDYANANDKNCQIARMDEYITSLAGILVPVLAICGKRGFNIEEILNDYLQKL